MDEAISPLQQTTICPQDISNASPAPQTADDMSMRSSSDSHPTPFDDSAEPPKKKRKSWGQVLPKPTTNLPPRKRAKTEEEKAQRKYERVQRNRHAAHMSRMRKQDEMENLRRENERLKVDNTDLENEIQRLREELSTRGFAPANHAFNPCIKHEFEGRPMTPSDSLESSNSPRSVPSLTHASSPSAPSLDLENPMDSSKPLFTDATAFGPLSLDPTDLKHTDDSRSAVDIGHATDFNGVAVSEAEPTFSGEAGGRLLNADFDLEAHLAHISLPRRDSHGDKHHGFSMNDLIDLDGIAEDAGTTEHSKETPFLMANYQAAGETGHNGQAVDPSTAALINLLPGTLPDEAGLS